MCEVGNTNAFALRCATGWAGRGVDAGVGTTHHAHRSGGGCNKSSNSGGGREDATTTAAEAAEPSVALTTVWSDVPKRRCRQQQHWHGHCPRRRFHVHIWHREKRVALAFLHKGIVQPPMPPLLVTANRGRPPLCMWETTHSASPPWLLPWQPSRWRRPWRQWREVIAVGPSRLPLAPVGTLPAAAAARFEMDEGYNNTTIQTRKRENNRVGARWSTPGVHCATGGRPRTESHTLAEAVVPTQPPPL